MDVVNFDSNNSSPTSLTCSMASTLKASIQISDDYIVILSVPANSDSAVLVYLVEIPTTVTKSISIPRSVFGNVTGYYKLYNNGNNIYIENVNSWDNATSRTYVQIEDIINNSTYEVISELPIAACVEHEGYYYR